jgi:hypothetical protein
MHELKDVELLVLSNNHQKVDICLISTMQLKVYLVHGSLGVDGDLESIKASVCTCVGVAISSASSG